MRLKFGRRLGAQTLTMRECDCDICQGQALSMGATPNFFALNADDERTHGSSRPPPC